MNKLTKKGIIVLIIGLVLLFISTLVLFSPTFYAPSQCPILSCPMLYNDNHTGIGDLFFVIMFFASIVLIIAGIATIIYSKLRKQTKPGSK